MIEFLARRRMPDRSGCQAAELVLRKLDHNAYHPFVTHQHNLANGDHDGFYWGHYFADEAEAWADFNERCAAAGCEGPKAQRVAIRGRARARARNAA